MKIFTEMLSANLTLIGGDSTDGAGRLMAWICFDWLLVGVIGLTGADGFFTPTCSLLFTGLGGCWK